METLIAVFVGIIGAVGGGIGLHVWQRYFLERISVKRITKPTDTHVQGLLDLYKSNFLKNDDDTNYSLSEVAEFMNDKPEERRHVEGENIVLVAILKSEVVGFLFCHFYPERRKAIISYFAIDKRNNEARIKAADRLLLKLKKILIKGFASYSAAFTRVDAHNGHLSAASRLRAGPMGATRQAALFETYFSLSS